MRKSSHSVGHQTTGYNRPIPISWSLRKASGFNEVLYTYVNRPPLDPDVADAAPNESAMTTYDEQHVVTYMRLLQADSEGADWGEVARIVLHIDSERELGRARSAYQSHLARAKWLTEEGRLLCRSGSK
jgi:hypothetical protein